MSQDPPIEETAQPLPSFADAAYGTDAGTAVLGDSLKLLKEIPDDSVDLVFTSPPFALRRKKAYGNKDAEAYVEWFLEFARELRRVLKDTGSLVIDIGGSWNEGEPTKSLYHYRLLLELVDKVDFHLAQEVFWYNPARLPTPAEWVCRQRVRLKDAVNMVWWLSKTEHPQADNRRVLTPYKADHKKLIASNKYNRGARPSEHQISDKFGKDNGGAIPPNFLDQSTLEGMDQIEASEIDAVDNLLRASNTSSTDLYIKRCKEIGADLGRGLHPARIPRALPEFFVKLLTKENGIVLDPFAGSNMTGAVAEALGRRWIAMERDPNYLYASQCRFHETEKVLATAPRFRELAERSGFKFLPEPPLARADRVLGENLEDPRTGEVGEGHELVHESDGQQGVLVHVALEGTDEREHVV